MYWFLLFYLFIFFTLQPLYWKVTFSSRKAYSSHNFQPTGIGLGSLWRGTRCVRVTNYLSLPINLFLKNLKFLILPKNYAISKKFPKIYYSFFFQKEINGHTHIYIYICTKCNDNFKFTILFSKFLWGVVFSMSARKCLFIFYNSFSLRLKENLHKKKHFLKTWSTCFVYIIFL